MLKQVNQDPFSNGTEYMIWLEKNCERCWKASHPKTPNPIGAEDYTKVICAIERDIFTRMWSNAPISQRTIDICHTFNCPFKHEHRKRTTRKYDKYKDVPYLL